MVETLLPCMRQREEARDGEKRKGLDFWGASPSFVFSRCVPGRRDVRDARARPPTGSAAPLVLAMPMHRRRRGARDDRTRTRE